MNGTENQQPTLKKLSCRTLQLNLFLDALIEGDRDVISEADWPAILEEFYTLSQNKNFAATYFLYRDIEYLKTKLAIIERTCEMLRRFKHDGLYKVLEAYDYFFDWAKPESLDRVLKRSKTEAAELERLQVNWNKQTKTIEESREQLYTYFGSWLDAMSDHSGFLIEPTKITVADFCRRMLNLQHKSKAHARHANRRNI